MYEIGVLYENFSMIYIFPLQVDGSPGKAQANKSTVISKKHIFTIFTIIIYDFRNRDKFHVASS
jgi:hypothetical protein